MRWSIFSLLLVLPPVTGLACTCVYIPTFCQTLTFPNDTISAHYVIVHARAERHTANGLKIRVIDLLYGDETEHEIEIRRGNGANCLVNTDLFTLGKDYIFAFHGKHEGLYSLSYCGVTWLEVANGLVTGAITEEITSIPIHKLDEVMECPGLSPGTGSVAVYPNPVFTSINIDVDLTVEAEIEVSLYDISGKQVWHRDAEVIMPGVPYEVNVSQIPPGTYLLIYAINGIRETQKIVVVPAF